MSLFAGKSASCATVPSVVGILEVALFVAASTRRAPHSDRLRRCTPCRPARWPGRHGAVARGRHVGARQPRPPAFSGFSEIPPGSRSSAISVAVGLVGFPAVVLAWQWLRARVAPTRLEATGPASTALNMLVLAALLLTPWYAPPLSFTTVSALVFYGASMLLADGPDSRRPHPIRGEATEAVRLGTENGWVGTVGVVRSGARCSNGA
jgi:hypothetical protein